jgi:hypothetical protein
MRGIATDYLGGMWHRGTWIVGGWVVGGGQLNRRDRPKACLVELGHRRVRAGAQFLAWHDVRKERDTALGGRQLISGNLPSLACWTFLSGLTNGVAEIRVLPGPTMTPARRTARGPRIRSR